MELEALGAAGAERLLWSGAPVTGFVLAQEPHELGRWDVSEQSRGLEADYPGLYRDLRTR